MKQICHTALHLLQRLRIFRRELAVLVGRSQHLHGKMNDMENHPESAETSLTAVTQLKSLQRSPIPIYCSGQGFAVRTN